MGWGRRGLVMFDEPFQMYPGECNLMSLTQLVSASKMQFPALIIFACTHNLYCISCTRSLLYCLCCIIYFVLESETACAWRGTGSPHPCILLPVSPDPTTWAGCDKTSLWLPGTCRNLIRKSLTWLVWGANSILFVHNNINNKTNENWHKPLPRYKFIHSWRKMKVLT